MLRPTRWRRAGRDAGGRRLPRDAALGAFRRHLARIQAHVQHAFEQRPATGLKAARQLAALIDGLIAALYGYALAHGAGRVERRTG